MEKVIDIGGVKKTFRATGATPIKYRKLFKGADFFGDLNRMKNIDIENIFDTDIEGIERIAFAMCEDSNDPGMSFETWAEQFDLSSLLKAMPEVVGLIVANLDTQTITGTSKNAVPAES